MQYRTENGESLHSKASLAQAIANQRSRLKNEIMALSEKQLSSCHLEELVSHFSDKYSITIPLLDESNITPTRAEVDIDQSEDPRRVFLGGPRLVKGTAITISVPYTGDTEVFRMHASQHVMNYPIGYLSAHSIAFVCRGTHLDPQQVRREFDTWVAVIKQHLDGMRTELGNFNEAIKLEISKALNERLEKLKRDEALLSGLGFAQPIPPT